MARLPLRAFLTIPIVLAACLGQTPTPDGALISVPATADTTSLATNKVSVKTSFRKSLGSVEACG